MAELMALLRAPNRTSSNSTPPLRYGPTVDPNPWVPPTHAPEGVCPTSDALSTATPSATSILFRPAGLLSVAGPAQLCPYSSSNPTKQASGFENSSAGATGSGLAGPTRHRAAAQTIHTPSGPALPHIPATPRRQ
ncbi:hypothetical protein CRG98_031312 [Punica granatum]|uniref:Uncharacterized protein n=1 Tax=Punica granatum TaxID=22663 RepID=A0A2I0IXY5_PUNGR|nr:hypothetical protein CRG98_031312 [Punica granatum]